MATKITTSVGSAENPGASIEQIIEEDFDQAMELMIPLKQASSALEARENLTMTKRVDGRRICIRPEVVAVVEELGDDE